MAKQDLKIISFNVRGLNNMKKRKSIFDYLKKNQCDVAFLQETYSSIEDETRWLQEWEGTGYMVHGTNHSRGVAILFRKQLEVEILSSKFDFKSRFILLKTKINDEHFNLINIYAPNKEKEQIEFLEDIRRILITEKVIAADNNVFAGDWNMVLDKDMDKLGGQNSVKSRSVVKLRELINDYNLIDIWRLKNEKKKRYTWRQNKPRVHCRLDYFLISHHVMDLIVKTHILPSILSDHSPVSIDLKFLEEPLKGSGHWKLNLSLLNDQEFKILLRQKMTLWIEEYKHMQNKNLKWELLKYEIRRYCMRYSKKKKVDKHERKSELEKQLLELEEMESVNDAFIYNELDRVKLELNTILLDEAQGSIVRSRARWIEEGEKSTSYFFNLEKQNAIKKNIRKLIHNNKEVTNQAEILNALLEYYQNLYKFQPTQLDDNNLFTNPLIPKLFSGENSM